MTVGKFTIRGGEDWLLFAQSNDPDDDRAYVAVTECWPVWLDAERRYGPECSLTDP